jgi:hypothetical protein
MDIDETEMHSLNSHQAKIELKRSSNAIRGVQFYKVLEDKYILFILLSY